MKLCYSDPPYFGQAKRHYRDDPSGIPAEEVDYPALVAHLLADYDGFALSASAPSIHYLNILIHGAELDPKKWLNKDVRIAPWVKPHCSWKPWNSVAYTWEPVFFRTVRCKGARPTPRDHFSSVPTAFPLVNPDLLPRYLLPDHLSCNSTRQRGTHGAKPDAFCEWVLDLIGYDPARDTIEDMYPGSGAFTRVAKNYKVKVMP
jgi:hypothetical protein